MYFKFGDKTIDFEVMYENDYKSRHSGKILQDLKIKIAVDEKYLEDFRCVFKSAQETGIISVNTSGETLKHWVIGNNSSNSSSNSSIHHYQMDIREVEHLQPSLLTIGELNFNPYYYSEHFDGNDLCVDAKVVLDQDRHNAIKIASQESRQFPVIRHGINEEIRLMNLSLGLWSKENDKIKIQIKLTEATNSSPPESHWMIFLSHAISKSFENNAMIELLLSSLASKDVFSEQEIEQIREEACSLVKTNINKMSQVQDVDNID
jgi:hypothetical protein